jgi:catechol 1,2-dioxygenase
MIINEQDPLSQQTLKVSAPGHQTLTTQLYFRGGRHVADNEALHRIQWDLPLFPCTSVHPHLHQALYTAPER